MMNLGNMMKAAQKMQTKMAELQEQLADLEITGQSAGGMVTAMVNGKNELRRLKIDPSLIDRDDAEVLEDLIVAAVNDARLKVEQEVQSKTAEVMGDLGLPPGFKLPFG
ncbi:MAG: YbaB/EbfC family nucleoid-associated protein [Alphaproteobacteria bacterium]|nr:YbaB/EbfC family nucleoid-associated protein [Alphaproteobacteria bacterium]